MASHLDFEGKYDPDKRFVITNWLSDTHYSFWDSRPITIPAGGMYECDHAIAYKLTKEIVDKAMYLDADEKFKNAGGNDAYAQKVRERAEMALNSKDLRKPYEDKTISEIVAGEENPIMAKMRAEIRVEEQQRLSNEQAVNNLPVDAAGAAVGIPTEQPIRRRIRAKGEFEDGAKTL